MSKFNYIQKTKQYNSKAGLEFTLFEFTAGFDKTNPLKLIGKCADLDHNKQLEIVHRTKYARKIAITSRRLKSEVETGKVVLEFVREAYPDYVFYDWNVKDENGDKIPYSAEGCREFLTLLEDHVMVELMSSFQNLDNFMDDIPLNHEDGVDVGFISSKQLSGKKKTETE